MDLDADTLVIGCWGGLILVGLVSIVFIIRRTRSILRLLRDVDGFLLAMRSDDVDENNLVRAVREHVVRSETPDGQRFVLSMPLPALRREFAEGEVAHALSFSIGSLLTGVALIVTFLLIAWVMKHDVSGAIRESVNADASATGHLSDAVINLGGKFYISAAGIGGSVGALLVGNWCRGLIYRVAEHPGPVLLGAFTSIEAQQLNAKLHELELHRADRETRADQHEEMCAYLASLQLGVQRLGSIEVSVKTIGNEVSANLKNIMKDAMGEQLKGMLADTMVEVATIATRVQESLSDSFGAQLHALTTELQRSLTALHGAVEGQGQGQLEQILTRLQDTVSGGFQSESQKMIAALEGFARVVPALETQLSAMTGQVAVDTRRRSEEAASATQQVFDKVQALLVAMDAQQAANAKAIERLTAIGEHGAEDMARRLEASGKSVVGNVLGASRVEIEAILGQLRTAAEASSNRYGELDAQARGAASAVAQASDALKRSAGTIAEISGHTSTVLAQARSGSEAIQSASREFVQAGKALLGTVSQIDTLLASTRVQTKEQHELLLRQREYTKEVEKLWPELFDTYLAKFRAGADELGRSWDAFHQKIASLSSTVGAEFAENTSVLSESVDRLVKLSAGAPVRR